MNYGKKFNPYLQKILNSEFKKNKNFSHRKFSSKNYNTNNNSITSHKISFIKLLCELDKKENIQKKKKEKNKISKLKSKKKIENEEIFLNLKLKEFKERKKSNSISDNFKNENSKQNLKNKFNQVYKNKIINYRNLNSSKLLYLNSTSNNSISDIFYNSNNYDSLIEKNDNLDFIKIIKENNNNSNQKTKFKGNKLYCSTEPDKKKKEKSKKNSMKKNKIIKSFKAKNKLLSYSNNNNNNKDLNIKYIIDSVIKKNENKNLEIQNLKRNFSDEKSGEKIYKNKTNNNISFSEISIPDENITKIFPLTINYNKQIYSNNYISNHLRNLFFPFNKNKSQLKYNFNHIFFQFLSIQDIFNLSFVNKFFFEVTSEKIYLRIQKNFSQENKYLYEIKLWKKLYEKSKFNLEKNTNFNLIFNNNISSKYKNDILIDLNRTFPNDPLFNKDSDNLKKLFNILLNYSIYNNKIGYAQGINFIVATLIKKFSNEKEVFIYFDIIMKILNFDKIVGINNKNLVKTLNFIQNLIQINFPLFNNYLIKNHINHEFFTVNWIITLFSKNFKNEKILFELWNYIIIFKWKFIYLFIISIIKHFQNKLIQLDLYYFTLFMKDIFDNDEFYNNYNNIIKCTFQLMSHNYFFDNNII